MAVLVAAPAYAGNKTSSPANAKRLLSNKCSKCAHAPCRCGYSPSYYTHYRKPVCRVAKHYPIPTHWSRGHTTRTPRVTTSNPGPRRDRTVPAPIPRQSLGTAPTKRSRFSFDTSRTRYFGRHRPSHGTPVFSCNAPAPTPGTLVPSPRRASTLPTLTPRVSLGYVPARTSSHFRNNPVFRRGGKKKSH